ncbi:CvfB family protein [Lachnoclostridium phytofermentans]|uniref:RNA binding S1 domain protein n=1 Tax=Lachnoclostridium phytofermentans (strain ATCC 700394 / DSM 18823 / ISDg) TaxID=357809 RepID=A9KS06_LACP7|nr:S1-like domain-containing RNA-binding protein [Lachnoclostridium phytofermentans]ABX40637.1 RNA binding S1 domain protein [Lachnoclostridium phytofermentans ISDg]
MIQLGKIQTLTVAKTTDFGVYLADNDNSRKEDTILLPKNQVAAGTKIGDQLSVFVYKDSEDRPIATQTTPKLTLKEIAVLKVKEVTTIGAFLDWGIAKDLFLPFKEQTHPVIADEEVLVSLYIDKSKRLCATMKIYDMLQTDSPYGKDDKVTGIVYEIIPAFGAFVAVDNKYSALIPNKELHTKLNPGETVTARVTMVQADGKLDLSLREKTYLQLDSDAEIIYEKLTAAGGFLPFHDKSEPDAIKKEFNLSKNAFKRAIGRLMKDNKIKILEDGIQIV